MAKNKLTICKTCGAEIAKSAKRCPQCGAKNKKPIFKRVWFWVLVAVVAIVVGKSRISWSSMELADKIPTPPSKIGTVYKNSNEELNVSLKRISDSQYNAYLKKCIKKGFSIDADQNSYSYKAYNADGYCLNLKHIGKELSITLEAPIEFGTIKWPSGTAGNMLPKPKSSTGKFLFQQSDSFFVYISETSKADYDSYVATCAQKGFMWNNKRGDSFYYADNADGWHISLRYEGNSIMTIRIDAPHEKESEPTATVESVPEETATEETKAVENETEEATELANDTGIDPEFQAAMDAYEAFYAEYCEFLKKYKENPTDLTLLAKYASMLSKAEEMDKTFEAWNEDDLNSEELKYYLDVNNRVMKMLVDVMS